MMKKLSYTLITLLAGIAFLYGCQNNGTSPKRHSNYHITLNVNPIASGKVTPGSGNFTAGDKVNINATPAAGYNFDKWSGDYTGSSASATVTVDKNRTITANFVQQSYNLTVNTVGMGSVNQKVVQGKSISYKSGTKVQLTAHPETGWKFDHWEGALSGSDNPQTLTVDNAKQVTAVFTQVNYELTVNADHGGVDQEIVTAKSYPAGTVVRLTANPNAGYVFDHWEDDLTGTDNPDQITMDGPKTATAIFTGKQVALEITKQENGNGSVTKTPNSTQYRVGSVVQLTANPGSGQVFVKWSGDVAAVQSTDNPLSYTVGISNQIVANFEATASNKPPDSVKIRGVNWADKRDNFVNGKLVPSGLSTSDDTVTIRKETKQIVTEFKKNMGANTIRLPINPPTVLTSWWKSYKVVINEALNNKMKIILAVWEADSSKDGRVDNMNKFWSMWQNVVNTYKDNPHVYMEVFNEPHGYSSSALTNIYQQWLNRFSSVPRDRVLLDGTGYARNVKTIGSQPQLDGCLLAIHLYAFFANHNQPSGWEHDLMNNIGKYASRTVATEFGTTMDSGLNFEAAANGNQKVAYMQGMTDAFKNYHISSVYWPGLSIADHYSIQKLNQGQSLTLSTTNKSGLKRIRYGWGLISGQFDPRASYKLINKNSGYVLGVKDSSNKYGARIIQEKLTNNTDQLWSIKTSGIGYFRFVNEKSGLVLDVNGASTNPGTKVIQWPWNAGKNQQWKLLEQDTKIYLLQNHKSNLFLDVQDTSTTPQAGIIQMSKSNGESQRWEILNIR